MLLSIEADNSIESELTDEQLHDNVAIYLHSIHQTPEVKTLTYTESKQLALAREWAEEQLFQEQDKGDAGDPAIIAMAIDEQVKARNGLTESVLRMITKVASHYSSSHSEYLDLVQEGNLGAIQAAEKYDWRTGYRFSTYSYYWIEAYISRAKKEDSRAIHLPLEVGEILKTVDHLDEECLKKEEASDLRELIAKAILSRNPDYSPAKLPGRVQEIANAALIRQIIFSLDAGKNAIFDDRELFAEHSDPEAPSTEDLTISRLRNTAVQQVLNNGHLTANERNSIKLHHGISDNDPDGNYYEELSFGQIGNLTNRTSQNASQAYQRGLAKLRQLPALRELVRAD